MWVLSRGILLNFSVQSGWGQEYTRGNSSSEDSLIAGTGWSGMGWSSCFCWKLLNVTSIDVPCVDGKAADVGRGPPLLTQAIASLILHALAASTFFLDGRS